MCVHDILLVRRGGGVSGSRSGWLYLFIYEEDRKGEVIRRRWRVVVVQGKSLPILFVE
jgi:hypothetical protein